jgi:ADP-ribosyl-[dinitrogen reductase] hydrolase
MSPSTIPTNPKNSDASGNDRIPWQSLAVNKEARTMTDTLKIGTIPSGHSGGSWGITMAPGKKGPSTFGGHHNRDMDEDLDTVANWGANAVLTLMETDELTTFKMSGIEEGVRSRFMEWHHLPIKDLNVPGAGFEKAWPEVSGKLRSLVARGGKVLVHCRGGLGRAGMVVSRLLVEDGAAPGDSIDAVRAVRGPIAVETRQQVAWVGSGGPVVRNRPSKTHQARRERALGALLGLAAGDALGTTLEFTSKPSRAILGDMVGGGPFRLAAGQWTDDTAMALALADSLVADAGLDPIDLMNRFVDWHAHGTYSCTGRCFDIGNTTSAALGRYRRSGNPLAGSDDPNGAGNGSIMRLAPAAIRHWHDRTALIRVADLQGRTTHGAEEARLATTTLAEILADAIEGRPLNDILAGSAVRGLTGYGPGQSRKDVRGAGYVVASLHAAVWAVSTTTDFRGAVLAAANLGEDADTTAAIAGQIAGAIYGREGIPKGWLAKLAWANRLKAVASDLFQASMKERG